MKTISHALVYASDSHMHAVCSYPMNNMYELPWNLHFLLYLYNTRRTNLPKELMDIPELPFREDLPSFIGHREMLEYLRDLATAFDLHKHVRFHTNVESVEPVERESRQADDDVCGVVSGGIRDSVRWRVQTRDLELGTVSKEIYDIVVVCNGSVQSYSLQQIMYISSYTLCGI